MVRGPVLVVGIVTGLLSQIAYAFDYNDCILQGMKGVTNNIAKVNEINDLPTPPPRQC